MNKNNNIDYFEKNQPDVLLVALKELLKRKPQSNVNINVYVDNRSLSVVR